MNKDYYEVFQKRSSRFGKDFKTYATENAHRNFLRVLKSSPNSIDVTLNNSTSPIKALTLSNTDKETKDIREFCFEKDSATVGDFIHWDSMVWLIYNKEIDTVNAYDKFEAILCQHIIKWVDEFGLLQETPAYVGGLASNIIKLFYNRSNSTVVLDPAENNYLSVMTARKDIKLGKRMIIGDRAWKLVESDYITVPEICYLSLTEDKLLINNDGINNEDDLENKIADVVDLNKFSFNNLPDEIEIGVGENYTIDPTIYLNGTTYIEQDSDLIIEVIDTTKISYANRIITGLSEGEAQLIVKMAKNKDIQKQVKVIVVAEAEDIIEDAIIGDDSIKVGGRQATYEFKRLVNGASVVAELEYFICEGTCASGVLLGNNMILTSNNKNNLGTILLKAKFTDGNEIQKEVKIKSLWG